MRKAAAAGDVAAIESWVASPVCQIDAVDANGRTALMAAAHGPKGAAVIGPLVAAGASLDARDEHGCTALMLAALRGRAAAAQQLLDAGAPPDATDPRDATQAAAPEPAPPPTMMQGCEGLWRIRPDADGGAAAGAGQCVS